MTKPIQVSASILCADFAHFADSVKMTEQAGVDRFHVDVMDGHFVPNLTIGAMIVETLRPLTTKPIEAHLMIENPGDYIEDYAKAGADIIQIHVECYGERRVACQKYGQWPKEVDNIDVGAMRNDLKKIRTLGKQAYAVINPGTLLRLEELKNDLDGVLIMSVNPGFAKQKFKAEVLDKVKDLRDNYDLDIALDGGVNAQTAPGAIEAGAHVLISASYLYGADDPAQAVSFLKSLAG